VRHDQRTGTLQASASASSSRLAQRDGYHDTLPARPQRGSYPAADSSSGLLGGGREGLGGLNVLRAERCL